MTITFALFGYVFQFSITRTLALPIERLIEQPTKGEANNG